MKNHTTIMMLLTISMLAMLPGVAVANDVINLRTSVRMTGESDSIYLRDIAEIRGQEALRYTDVKIATVRDPERVLELHVREVRLALDDAGVHWGRVNLNGSRVLVRPRGRMISSPPMAMSSVSVDVEAEKNDRGRKRDQRSSVLAEDVIKLDTLRSAVASFLAANMDIDPEQLKLEFDNRDDDALDASLGSLRFEIEPITSVRSNRVELAVRIWDENRVHERMTVRIMPTIYMPVVMMKRDVSRGSVVTEDDVEVVHQWLPPIHSGLVTREQEAIGRIATIRLSAGEALRDQHVRRETLVRRGDLVVVRALVGGSVLSIQAEARAAGSEGDTIEFRKVGERDTFLATVTGRSEAVIDLQR